MECSTCGKKLENGLDTFGPANAPRCQEHFWGWDPEEDYGPYTHGFYLKGKKRVHWRQIFFHQELGI